MARIPMNSQSHHKQCSKCRVQKPILEFGYHAYQPDKRHYYCKACVTAESQKRKGQFVRKAK